MLPEEYFQVSPLCPVKSIYKCFRTVGFGEEQLNESLLDYLKASEMPALSLHPISIYGGERLKRRPVSLRNSLLRRDSGRGGVIALICVLISDLISFDA